MSPYQIKRQLAYLAATALWGSTPYALLYTGGAFVSEDLEGNFKPGDFLPDGPVVKTGTTDATGVTPFCRVRCTGVDFDGAANATRISRVSLQMFTPAGGGGINGPGLTTAAGYDTHGINQVTGVLRSRSDGAGKSQGRDVDEIWMRWVEQLGGLDLVDSVHGFQGFIREAPVMQTVDGVQILKRSLSIDALNATTANYYHPVTGASGVAAAGPVVNITWTPPPLRFDSMFVVVRRGNTSGAPAPGIDNGTFVFGGMPDDSAAVDDTVTLTSGTWNYSVFVFYTESPAGWPTIEALLTSQPVDSAIKVFTNGGDFLLDMSGTDAPTLAGVATNVAAVLNGSGAAVYMTATASGAFVTLEPIGTPPWLGVRRDGVGLARTNGTNYAQATFQVVVP